MSIRLLYAPLNSNKMPHTHRHTHQHSRRRNNANQQQTNAGRLFGPSGSRRRLAAENLKIVNHRPSLAPWTCVVYRGRNLIRRRVSKRRRRQWARELCARASMRRSRSGGASKCRARSYATRSAPARPMPQTGGRLIKPPGRSSCGALAIRPPARATVHWRRNRTDSGASFSPPAAVISARALASYQQPPNERGRPAPLICRSQTAQLHSQVAHELSNLTRHQTN